MARRHGSSNRRPPFLISDLGRMTPPAGAKRQRANMTRIRARFWGDSYRRTGETVSRQRKNRGPAKHRQAPLMPIDPARRLVKKNVHAMNASINRPFVEGTGQGQDADGE